jgi:hypothetical protein
MSSICISGLKKTKVPSTFNEQVQLKIDIIFLYVSKTLKN